MERLPAEGPARDYPARPIVGVGAVVLADAGEQRRAGRPPAAGLAVVLVKRRFAPLAGQWSLPGGVLETGETLQAAAARETAEETGLQVEVGPVVEVFDYIAADAEARVRHHYVLVDYLCVIRAGSLRAGSDAADVAFAAVGRIPDWGVSAKVIEVVGRAVELRQRHDE